MLRNIRLLYVHSFLTDFTPQAPYQVIFFAQLTGSYTVAMSVLGVETLTAALLDIGTGVLSDRLGRKVIIAAGSACAALGTASYAAAHGQALLYLGAIFVGASQCLFNGNNNALLFETLQAEANQERFAHYRAGVGACFQAALSLSAFLAIALSAHGLRAVFVAATLPQLLAIPVSLMLHEPRVHLVQKQKSLALVKDAAISMANNPKLFLMVLGKGINYGVGESKFKFQSAFVSMVWPIGSVGLYRGINHAISFSGYFFARLAIRRFKPLTIFAFRDIYWFVSQSLGLMLDNVLSPLLFVSGAFVFGPGEVASDHLLQQEFTDEQRATMGSLASSVTSLVFAAAAVTIGAVSDRYGVIAGLALGVGLNVLSLPIYLSAFRKTRRVQ